MTAVSTVTPNRLGHDRGHEVTRGIRGLLHDLGHQLLTLSLLAETVRSDSAMSAESRHRIDLVQQEMFRAMDMIADHLADEDDGQDALDVRELAGQAAQLTELAHGAKVTLLPGPRVTVPMSPAAAWRVLSNLVNNAARSAGPGGHVQISIRQDDYTVIDVLDDGPGFGRAPAGMAGIGLSVVRQLVDAAGGRLEVTNRPAGGTRARLVFVRPQDPATVPAQAPAGHWA